MLARIPIIDMTIIDSIRVNPARPLIFYLPYFSYVPRAVGSSIEGDRFTLRVDVVDIFPSPDGRLGSSA